jgi:hypothetical protein
MFVHFLTLLKIGAVSAKATFYNEFHRLPSKRLLKWPLDSPGGSKPVIGPQEKCGRVANGTRAMAVESGAAYHKIERLLVHGPVTWHN